MSIYSICRTVLTTLKSLIALIAITIVVACTYFWFVRADLLVTFIPRIETELGRKLKAQVKISDLTVKLYPSIGFSMNSVSVKPDNSCGTIFAEHGSLYMDLHELLEGRFLIDSMAIVSSKASISVAEGLVTLVDESDLNCAPHSVSASSVTATTVTQIPENPLAFPIIFNLEKLDIEDLSLSMIGTNPHKIIISKLTSGGSYANGIFKLITPEIKATVDSIPNSITADSLELDFNSKSVTFNAGVLNLADQIIKLSGVFQSANRFQAVKITASALQLPQLVKALQSFKISLPSFTSGTGTISAIFNASETKGLEIDGNLKVSNFGLSTSKIKFSEISLQSAHFKHFTNGITEFSANTELNNFSTVNGEISYISKKAQGPIRIRQIDKRLEFSGQLNIAEFEFRDGLTELRNVSGRLSDIKATRDQIGNIKVALKLDGSSIQLKDPSVTIHSVKSVNAPLNISVSNMGVYSVTGLVSAANGSISISNRELNELSGQVQILISTAKKEFNTQKVTAKVNERQISTKGKFTMTPESYLLQEFQASLNQGTLKIDGSLQRAREKKFSTKLVGTNIKITDVLSLAHNKEDQQMEGTIALFNSELQGNGIKPIESLQGKGSLQVVETKVKGFDLSRAIGTALSNIPFSNIKLSPDQLTDDQRSKTAEGEFSIANQIITFSKAKVYRSNYTLIGKGTLDFNLELDAKGSVIFAQKTLQSLGGGFDKLGNLIGKVGKVEIPLFIKGKSPNFSLSPDLKTLALDNSGLTFVGDVLGTTRNVGKSVKDFVLLPFNSKKEK